MARQKKLVQLTAAHYDSLQEQLEKLKHLPNDIKDAKAIGLNTEAYEQGMQDAKNAIELIKRTYFPNGRPPG